MVSNSGHDENGKFKGGVAGDQSKNEWYIRPWYSNSNGWNVVLRHPNEAVRNMIATLAEESANNNLIGYDQNQRTTFWSKLKVNGFRPKNITTACEADCSAGVSAIAKATGYLLGIVELQNISENNTTRTMKNAFKKAGFQVLTASKYLTSDKYLLRGDILLSEGHHTCTNLTNGAKAVTSTPQTTVKITPVANGDFVKKAQNGLNIYINAELAVDGSIGALTRKATAKALQYSLNRDYGSNLVVDGDIGAKTLSALKGKAVKKGAKSYLVTWLEISLMLLGYYNSSIEIAGSFGAGVDKAVRNFQTDNGLVVDGSAGENTIKKILSNLALY